MKFRNFLSKLSGAGNSPLGKIISAVIPGVGVATKFIDAVNGAGGNVNEDTTVDELNSQLNALPENARAALMEKEIDLAIVESNNYAEVAIAQEQNKSATRPAIAQQMSNLFCQFAFLSFFLLVVCAGLDTYQGDTAKLFTIAMDGLPWLAGTYAVPAMGIIQDYFARRSEDKRTAAALTGQAIPGGGRGGILSSLTGMFVRK